MNKRIKLKKGILHKRCDEKCVYYRLITREKFTTNNICIGCKHIEISDKICEENEKFWNSMTQEKKREYKENKTLDEIAGLSNVDFAKKVKDEFHSKYNVYDYSEYKRILYSIRRALIMKKDIDTDILIKCIKSEVQRRFY